MNTTINLTHFSALLSAATGFPESSAKQFIIELAEALSSALAKGNEVKIKGLGTFVPSEDEMVGVVFIPDDDMAREVNAPFEMFEAVYLDQDVTDEMINEPLPELTETPEPELEPEPEQVSEPTPEPEPEQVSEPTPEPELEQAPELMPELEPEQVSEPTPESEPEQATMHEPTSEPEPTPEPAPTSSPKVEERIIYVERRGPGWGWVVAALLAGAAIGYFLPGVVNRLSQPEAQQQAQEVIVKAPQSDPLNVSVTPAVTTTTPQEEEDKPADVQSDEANSGVADDPPQPVITEVIDGHTYLTTIAKRYYGVSDFWSYIYEENKDKLGHPDKVPRGTTVVVPPKSKYNIDASNPASIKAAKELQAEIYSRF